jgi:O-antigen/teichoic acid export membrane protein
MQTPERLWLVLGGLAGLLLLAGVAAWLWARFYADDAQNVARRIAKNSAVPFGVRLVVRALDLLFALILYSMLPAPEIGRYTFAALLVPQFLGTISEFGLGVLLTREVAREPGASRALFGVTLLLRGALVLAVVPLAGLLVGGYELLAALDMGEAITPEGQQIIWVLLLTLIPGAYSGAVTALYHANERMEVPALVELVTAVLSVLLRIAALLLGFGILGLAWVAVLVSTLTALVYLWLQLRAFFRPVLQWDGALARRLLWLALPLMLNNLLNAIFFRIDTLVIKGAGGGQGDLLVQQYNLAYQMLSIALIVPPAITFAVFPLLSRQAAGERAPLLRAQNRTLQVLLLLAFPLSMGLTVLAPELVVFFTRNNADQYLPISAEVLRILAWFLPLSFANGLLQYVLIAVNRQHAITRAFLIGALFNLLANLALIPTFGLYAASLTTIASEVVLLAVFLPLLRAEGLTPPLLRLAWRPVLAALAMGAAMLLAGLLGWLAAVLVAPPVYAGVLWLLGGLGPEEVALARRVLGREG